MRHSAFEALNVRQEEEGNKTYVNPRNAAAGALRLKDANKSAERGLSIWCYQLAMTADHETSFGSHYESMQWLKSVGLPVNDHVEQAVSLAEITDAVNRFRGSAVAVG